MKTARPLVLLAIVLLLSPPIAMAVGEWWGAGATLARAMEAGHVRASEGAPLSLVEKTIVAAEFHQTWGNRGAPCRTLDVVTLARLAAGRHDGPGGAGVSVQVARQILRMEVQHSRTLDWHIQGALISCQLEMRYTDKELLRVYLSNAYFGQRAYGLHAAAQAYFGKDVDALDLDEASRLAAVLRAPNNYVRNEERWAERARFIAERVEQQGERWE